MRTNRLFLFLTASLLLSVGSVKASDGSDDASSEKKKGISLFYLTPDLDPNITILEFIVKDDELHFQDPTPPRFVLVDSQQKYALGIGGVVRGVTGSDFGGIVSNSYNEGFYTYDIAPWTASVPNSQALMSAATSEIYIKLVGKTNNLGHFTVYTSFNYMGENYTPQLRNAYVEFLGLSVGQRRSTFTDENAISPTIDYAGPTSFGGYHIPQIRYSRMFACEKMQFALAAEFPTVQGTYSDFTLSQNQQIPNVVGYIQKNTDGGHIRLSGVYRNMNYYNTVQQTRENLDGWGAQLSGLCEIDHMFTVYYQGVYGKGISSYINGLYGNDLDLVPNSMTDGKEQTLHVWGGYGGLKCQISENVYASATYSYLRLDTGNLFYTAGSMPMPETMYKYSQYYVVNAFWSLSDEMQVGLELLRGETKEHSNKINSANRINLLVQYNF